MTNQQIYNIASNINNIRLLSLESYYIRMNDYETWQKIYAIWLHLSGLSQLDNSEEYDGCKVYIVDLPDYGTVPVIVLDNGITYVEI